MFFLVLGILLVAAELLIFQLSVFWFLFVGLGALAAALAALFFPGISWFAAIAVFVAGTAGIALVAYRPLKRWQQAAGAMPGNDAIGQSVEVIETVSAGRPGKVLWSGTEWVAELASSEHQPIESGAPAHVVSLHGIRLTVAASARGN